MAAPTTLRATKLLIQLGDGASPEAFAAPCGLTTRGIDLSATTQDDEVMDCDDPDAPIWVARGVASLSAGVSGSGTLAMESSGVWRDWFLSGDPRNVRVKLDWPSGTGSEGGYYEMSAVLTAFNQSGEGKGLVQASVTLASNGAVNWVPA